MLRRTINSCQDGVWSCAARPESCQAPQRARSRWSVSPMVSTSSRTARLGMSARAFDLLSHGHKVAVAADDDDDGTDVGEAADVLRGVEAELDACAVLGLHDSGMQDLEVPVHRDGSAVVVVVRAKGVLPPGSCRSHRDAVRTMCNWRATSGRIQLRLAYVPSGLRPGLRGPGRVPAARGRAVALRVEPLKSGMQTSARSSCAVRWRGYPVRQSTHRAPTTAPPSIHERDLWKDLRAVGRKTGALLRLRRTPHIPHPFP